MVKPMVAMTLRTVSDGAVPLGRSLCLEQSAGGGYLTTFPMTELFAQ